MSKKIFGIISLLALLGAITAYIGYLQFYGSAVDENFDIYISRNDLGDAAPATIDSLVVPNITKTKAFKFYAKYLHLDARLKGGYYKINKGESVVEVVRKLKLGDQTPVKLMFNNVRTLPQLASKLSKQVDADSAAIFKAFKLWEIHTKGNIFNLIIPNTYEVYWTIPASGLVDRMITENERFWNDTREAKRKALKMDRNGVMILASIVYEETKKTDEMARVAGVYINRLKIGMPLQADPTVKFALQNFSLKRILYKHLEVDSPYNTYKYRGLPPFPIAMPSVSAIDAVLNYEKHNYLYFCARPTFDGYHNFAKSHAEHINNAKAYSAALNRLKIE